LPREVRDHVVGEHGIVKIECRPIRGTYDVKRYYEARSRKTTIGDGTTPVPVWDFVVTRLGGEMSRFHPDMKKKHVGVDDNVERMDVVPPAAGPGISEGPGSFRRFVKSNYKCSFNVPQNDDQVPNPNAPGPRGAMPGSSAAASSSRGDGQAAQSKPSPKPKRKPPEAPPPCASLRVQHL
jgi:hypothetical protein